MAQRLKRRNQMFQMFYSETNPETLNGSAFLSNPFCLHFPFSEEHWGQTEQDTRMCSITLHHHPGVCSIPGRCVTGRQLTSSHLLGCVTHISQLRECESVRQRLTVLQGSVNLHDVHKATHFTCIYKKIRPVIK